MYVFHAMNTDVAVIASDDEEAVATRVAATFTQAEHRYSRFRADSELSRLNRARGEVVVSEELFAALVRARAYVVLTDGLFDPCIGGALAALGYDRSFAPGALDRDRPGRTPRAGSFLDVRLDPDTRAVHRPEHLQIDLGGMLKGGTVDEAARYLSGSAAIDAGGDAIVRGAGPVGDGWRIEIEDPVDSSRTLATLELAAGAVATSAANRRTWHVGGRLAHHLIDPRTRTSAVTDLLQATVVAPRAERADVFAKTAFLLGSREARRFLERQPGVGAVLVRRDATPLFVGALDVREVNLA
jgi:thiamine biosynthesis lipoprotein